MHFLAKNKLKRIIWVQPSVFLANCLGKIGHAQFSGHCLFALISLVFYSWLDLSAKGCTFRGASLELPEGGLCVHLYYFLATSVLGRCFVVCRGKVKRPGFSNEEPESLYRCDSPWISSYQIQNSFQAVNQFNRFKHGFNYYNIQRICSTNFYYKPIGLNWNKQKMVAVAGLQAILQLELHLHMQQLSVARASKLQSYHPSLLTSNS